MHGKPSREALRIAVIYAVLAAAWIAFSDQVLVALVSDREAIGRFATYKGWLFVLVTASLLYFALRIHFQRERAALREMEKALREKLEYSRMAWRVGGVASFEYDTRKATLRSWPPIFDVDQDSSEAVEITGLMERVRPEDRDLLSESVQKADSLEGDGRFEFELRAARANGTAVWIRVQGQTIYEGSGAARVAVRRVGTIMDITERRRLQEQLLHAQRMDAVGKLAGGVAHDLNNILAPMVMGTGLLKASLKEPADGRLLALIEQSAKRGAGIVRQLLSFVRSAESLRAPVNAGNLVAEIGSFLGETFPRTITVKLEVAHGLWPVQADATQIYQVLMNLCVNARDAMPAGGELTLAAQNLEFTGREGPANPENRTGPHVVLTVSDTGGGIPSETLAHIFEPFFTTKAVGKGTGLGLPTAVGIVKSHGGFMTVASEPGRGSVFRVGLPAMAGAATAAAPETGAPPQGGHGELILVVDDEAPIRDTTRRVLERHNYRVLVASNGAEAMEQFIQHRENVRLVLTDVMMPTMDGPTLIRSLRVLEPKLRVMAMSGLSQRDKSDDLAALGVRDVLSKPFDSKALLGAISSELAVEAPPADQLPEPGQ